MTRSITLFTALLAVLALTACGSGENGNGDGDGGGVGMDGETPLADGEMPPLADGETPPLMDGETPPLADGEVAPDGGPTECVPVPCQGMIRECGDCIDNDGDGLIDADDPNCLNQCDNNEGGFDLGIPGGAAAPCRLDCYFDQDSGSGNDGCEWDHRCDPLEPSLNRPPTGCTCNSDGAGGCNPPASAQCPDPQSEGCIDFCSALTPRGCDCFGCCDLPREDGSLRRVFIGTVDSSGSPTCTAETMHDDVACRPCTPQPSCGSECRECDLCLGRTVDDLPEHCFDRPPPPDGGVPDGGLPDGGTYDDRCQDVGGQPCGFPGDDPCPDREYCLSGCCLFFG